MMKGSTGDFQATKPAFHVAVYGAPGTKPQLVQIKDLKAVFFVKDFTGKPGHTPRQSFDPAKPVPGRKIKVVFQDGEILVGTTQGYQPGRQGFFIAPADPDSNTERCYVVSAAAREITLL
jgi:hypothetical protein